MKQIDLAKQTDKSCGALRVKRFKPVSVRWRFAPLTIMVVSLALTACTTETTAATANPQPGVASVAAESCATSLSSLQQAAYSDGSGHQEALQELVACYDQLGEKDRATAARWRLYEDNTDY